MCLNSRWRKSSQADYDGTSDKGFNVAAATIGANPISLLACNRTYDEGAKAQPVRSSRLEKTKMPSHGVGGYLAKDEFKKDFSCFKATAYIDPVLDGTIAANAAMDWLEKDIIPYIEYKQEGREFGVYPFSATMIDASNYEEVMGESAN